MDDSSRPVLSEDACELFILLLDRCGLFPGDGKSHRWHLTESAVNLATELAKASDTSWEDEAILVDDASTSQLRRIEDGITKVRRHAMVFLDKLNDERTDVVDICRTLDMHLRQSSPVCWRLFAHSILEIYRLQSVLEEEAVKNSRVLDEVYTTIGRNKVGDWLLDLKRCLSREALIEQLYFREEMLLIRQLALHGNDQTTMANEASQQSATSNLPLNTTTQLNLAYAHADPNVVQANTIVSSIATLLQTPSSENEPRVSALLVIGSEGTGKTHLCDTIEHMASASSSGVHVIRPYLPLDILRGSVGETENAILSLCGAVRSHDGKVLVIIDDADHVAGISQDEQAHHETRCRSATLSLLDSLRTCVSPPSNVAFVLTTSNNQMGVELARFDKTFYLGLPEECERRKIVTNLLQNFVTPSGGDELSTLLSSIVDSTLGRSYSELVQYCRQSVEDAVVSRSGDMSLGFYNSVLMSLKQRLQAITPESLRAGVCDDYVEMRVLTARDLLSSDETKEGYNFPMKGESAANAWRALQTSIVIPLCRSKELHALLGEDTLDCQRSVVGATLLTGEPGCGKSEIALHCAKFVAQLLPSMKLIDVSCTSLIHKELGRSERAVHRMFDAARKAAPCVVLLDGIENIAAVRGNDSTSEGTMDRVLSTLLVELDGVDDGLTGHNGGIAVIGITHNPEWIDPALKRPGRLDRAVRLARDWD